MVQMIKTIELIPGENVISVFRLIDGDLLSDEIDNSTRNNMVVEACLRKMMQSNCRIGKLESGAPYIEGSSMEISISHSKCYYAIHLNSGMSVGVDVQVIERDLNEGKDYFVNEKELRNIEINSKNLYLIWSAKEAVYKKYKGQIEGYKDAMTIVSIDEQILVEAKKQTTRCGFLFEENFVLVYTLD